MLNVYELLTVDIFAEVDQALGVEHNWYETNSPKSLGHSFSKKCWHSDLSKAAIRVAPFWLGPALKLIRIELIVSLKRGRCPSANIT